MSFKSASTCRSYFAAWVCGVSLLLSVFSSAQRVRLMAANITSGNNQSYLDPGIRIFQGIKPDIAMIQEFNYGNNSAATIQGFVASTFGSEFSYFRESVGGDQIPNGIISRYPILESGEWDDTQVSNSRDFAWARIDIPGPKDLWVVSVHMLTTDSKRPAEATALRDLIQLHVPTTDYLVIGGDFNSDSRTETQFGTLDDVVVTTGPYPADRLGNSNTNASRGSPYDGVLPNAGLYALRTPVVIGASTFANGLVADTQIYSPIAEISPALAADSGVSGMQHMAVVKDFMIPVSTPPLIASTSPLAGGTIGTAVSRTLTATGGTTPYTWSISSGTIPNGLTFSSGGILSGTPTTAGAFTFTALVTDSTSATANKSFTVTITPTLVVASTTPLAGGTVGTAISRTLAAAGGTSPYTWSISSGTIPNGLTFSSGGTLSGTPTTAGTFTFTALVADSAGATANKSFTVTITPTLVVSSTSPLVGGTVGTAISRTIAATGGTSPYSWSILSGTIPNGLTFSGGGILSGTPTVAGTFTFSALVSDSASATANKSLTVTITPTLAISSASPLPSGTVGTALSRTLTAIGGAVPYSWSVVSGSIPGGLILTTGGELGGTPTVAGTFSFTAQVADSASATANKSFSVTITPTLAVESSPQLANGTIGTSYSQTLAASGGTPPYSWSIATGVLPAGLVLNGDGLFTGTPSTAGPFTFVAAVTDNTGATASKNFTITVAPTLVVSTSSVAGGIVGNVYSQSLTASGGTSPYTWSVTTGNLPSGIALGNTGTLDGTPTASGEFDFTVQVTDSVGATAIRSLVIPITPALAINSPEILTNGEVGSTYTQNLTATGGTAPYQWTLVGGQLPAGLSLDAGGSLMGTPTLGGTFGFEAKVTDGASSNITRSFSVAIREPLDAFLELHGLPADSANVDTDGDGLSNLAEFLLAGNPTLSDSSILPTLAFHQEIPAVIYQFTVTTSPGSVTWKAQSSTNLQTWIDVVPGVGGVTSTLTPGGATNQVSISIPSPAEAIYVRLKVTGP